MNTAIKLTAPLLLMIVILFSVPSCGPSVSQEDYDRISNDLIEAEKQLENLQNSLAESVKKDAQYKALSVELEDLKEELATKTGELETAEASYADLNTKFEELQRQNETYISEIASIDAQYEELKKQYEAVTQPPEEITIEDIEQTLFDLINRERINNDIDTLLWGKNLHGWARGNSYEMADTLKTKYSEWASWQEIFWATGYNTTEEIAQAAILIWRSNPYRYNQNIVNPGATYGAVGVYYAGDIYYITYMASISR